MENLAARFRKDAGERGGLRYSPELRRLAVAYAEQARARGERHQRIAAQLGVSAWSLSRWCRRKAESIGAGNKSVHEVVVVEELAASRPVLVMPSGIRVEGLSVRELVGVLEALR